MSNEIKYGLKNKGFILLGCVLNVYQHQFVVKDISYLLLIIISSLIVIYRPTMVVKGIVLVATLALAIMFSKYALFFPVLLYDYLSYEKLASYVLFPFIGIVLIVMSYLNQLPELVLYLFLGSLTLYFSHQTHQRLQLEGDYRLLEGSSHEQQYLLEKQNFNLIEEQNLNLTLGIAEERNRIARDIHDNVGHLLSSSLIQIGALRVINQADNLEEPLDLLDATIQEGMNNIRESVHNLHDDSLNLEQSLRYIVENFHDSQIDFHYAVKSNLPTSLKMDFLMIVRESLANVMKHSNGTKVRLEVVEQPAFYRLFIKDNGRETTRKSPVESGMGLNSMKERIVKQKGRLTAGQEEEGFQVLAIVPKGEEN